MAKGAWDVAGKARLRIEDRGWTIAILNPPFSIFG
jgi:hypothetical protein